MTRALVMTLLLAAACSDDSLFNGEYPDDIPCSDASTCPPYETCVPGEHMCRFSCNADGSCPKGSANIPGTVCDSDHYCRPACGFGMPAPAACAVTGGASCPSGQICDTDKNICRPLCSGADLGSACPTGFSCAALPQSMCGGCRPQ